MTYRTHTRHSQRRNTNDNRRYQLKDLPRLWLSIVKITVIWGRHVNTKVDYLIGVDGGGSGTRVAIALANGNELARGAAGTSALRHGADAAWLAVMTAITNAFSTIGLALPEIAQMAIGLGLSGVHNKQWAAQFAEKDPGFALLRLETDACTTLMGAHKGRAGTIVALGTGSVGEALLEDGSHREVGGWGFPCGDEAGGAWIGLRAMNAAQRVLDGRCPPGGFTNAVITHCGGHRDAVFNWLACAGQADYAQLTWIVLHWSATDITAKQIMQEAGREVADIAWALDNSETLPIALCGGLAGYMHTYLPDNLRARIVAPQGDSVSGALVLIQQAISKNNSEQPCTARTT